MNHKADGVFVLIRYPQNYIPSCQAPNCLPTMAVSLQHLLHVPAPAFLSLSAVNAISCRRSILFFKEEVAACRLRIARNVVPFGRSIVRYDDDDEGDENWSFDEAVALFNRREFYRCHAALESLWIKAEEPTRTLFHGILQCAVGFHHLFNHNHKGAMMELGEGLCKLRKMNFDCGPFFQFENDISAVLDFVYQTQIELAACTDDMCLAMDQSERSYQLLGGYAAGQNLYHLEGEIDSDDKIETMSIVFYPNGSYPSANPPRVKLPTLEATEKHLIAFTYDANF